MISLVCGSCQRQYAPSNPIWRCSCGSPLDLRMESGFPLCSISSRPKTLWRYSEALPITRAESVVTLGEGWTPLVPQTMAGVTVHLKHDYLFPTGSFKDRGASVLLSRVRELGIRHIIEDSSGNAGCAISAYAAAAGVRCDIFVPDDVPPEKAGRIRDFGGNLHRIPGGRDATARAALRYADPAGTGMRSIPAPSLASHVWDPFFLHGTKTVAFEICEQLGWIAPDTVFLPVGNGTLLLGAAMGFRELMVARMIERMPRLVGVQAERCCPLFRAFHEAGNLGTGNLGAGNFDHRANRNMTHDDGTNRGMIRGDRAAGEGTTGSGRGESEGKPWERPGRNDGCGVTVASGIAIPNPVRGGQIIHAIRESQGTILTVTEDEIGRARAWAIRHGIAVEPTGAVAVAGVARYLQGKGTTGLPSSPSEQQPGSIMVSVLTGGGPGLVHGPGQGTGVSGTG